ncbi:MAG TPA: hypothetical protein VGN14_17720 [Candidatus Elarobacter sp.]
MRAFRVLVCVAALTSPLLGGCAGAVRTDDCRISVDCSLMPFPAQSATSRPLAAIRTGPMLPADPAPGTVPAGVCPASLRPVALYPALPVSRAYRGPVVVGLSAALPEGWSLWIGDVTTGFAQQRTLAPAALPFPATLQPYPYADSAVYAVASDVTIGANDTVLAYVVAPDGARCAPAPAETALTSRSTT